MVEVSPELLRSVAAANWLTEADGAAVQIAHRLAAELDAASDVDELVTLSKALQGVLGSLGLTVSGRTGKASPLAEVNPLNDFRAQSAAISFRSK